MGKSDNLITEKRELQKSYEALEEENKILQAKLQSFSQNYNENMKKKDYDLQRSLEGKLEYETKIEHLQKQLKDSTIGTKTLKNDLDTERQKGKEILHENEVLKAKFGVLEENNKKLQMINDEKEEKEMVFKNRVDILSDENRELMKKIETIEKEYQAKLKKLEEVATFYLLSKVYIYISEIVKSIYISIYP